ncbi:ABC transporter ATP-binding protein [Iodidimonas gelatinilytica]|uniref:ABC transporter ATP-binding protein n=1 Tax=Iodidimonas gelatinilytica TaxID=1236966 RepID=A0A5A7MUJ3_9PROT|nr:ABC transporter ATP-binding protein [Iodidimonas gelatinilytica]GEQ98993.1 ABC transporter ATP-binding protein [Iodidimonas gelatinilytica]GEQ99763.1 ABC transporter ATP-binding protein [Iodidimonas gelatinilytica]
MTSPSAIHVRSLEKTYGGPSPKRALKGIDLDIPQGSMFGLLGPNGAGKSTFINILAGLVNKSSGEARVWGFDLDENPRNARASIGVVPQELVFDAFFTPWEMMEVQAGMYGVPKSERRTEELLKAVHLWDKRHAYSRTLSGGMKRRLLVAKAMVHTPPVLILDEPTAGVDIELRQLLWTYVRELHARGTTIVLTTHYLEEAEELCDTIAIINHGEVVCSEPTPDLLARIDEKEILIDLASEISEIPQHFNGFRARLAGPNRLAFQVSRKGNDVGAVLAALSASGLEVRDLSTDETDLEDIFLQLTRGSDADAAA